MTDRTVRTLQFLALQTVGAVAVIHLVVGVEQLSRIVANGLLGRYLTGMVVAHPRGLLFVVSAVAIGAGVVATARGLLPRRLAYLLGVVVLSTYLVGWVAWHTVLEHGIVLSGGAAGGDQGHTHAGLVDTLVSHYLEPIWATLSASASGAPGSGRTLLGVVSKTLELLGIGLLVALLRLDPAAASDGRGGLFGLENPEAE